MTERPVRGWMVVDVVGCPYCKAQPGQECRMPDGQLRVPHHRRANAAWLKMTGRPLDARR
jgi:hypothetical protein